MRITLAGCVILDASNRLLLIHRNTKKRTQWELPGGKIEDGEDTEAAAIRELSDELGIRVNIVRKLGSKTFKEEEYEMHYTWFLANIKNGEPILQEITFDDLDYFSFENLKEKNDISSNTRNLVDAYFSGEVNLK